MTTSVAREILGKSSAVQEMLRLIHRVSSSKTNVLIIGESGTGKELVARMIHESGPLKGKPFVPVNCGAIPETLIESEMFGHKKGSFTGAVSDKPGLFEAANGGTLFLDEVGELPIGMQVKLLRAIQERVFRRVGANEDVRVDVRIIAATNRDLEAAVAKGTFREDLYYRLNVLLIKTPPLRERTGDVQLLADSFLKKFAKKQQKEIQDFDPQVRQALLAYSWPGNVRELENVIERLVTLAHDDRVSIEGLPSQFQAVAGQAPIAPAVVQSGPTSAPDFSNGPIDLAAVLAETESKYIEAAMQFASGDAAEAAKLLGMTEKALRDRTDKKPVTPKKAVAKAKKKPARRK